MSENNYDFYSEWLLDEAIKYAARISDEVGVSDGALMYFKGLSDGFSRARYRYLEGE